MEAKQKGATEQRAAMTILFNQSSDPILVSGYDPGLLRRLSAYAMKYPDLCRRVDKRKYPDYAEYEIVKGCVSIRLLPPMSEEQKNTAREKAKAQGLGGRLEKTDNAVNSSDPCCEDQQR